MAIKSISSSAAMVGLALLLASPAARADVVQLTTGNTALTGAGVPSPYGSATITLVDGTHATVTFTAANPAGPFDYSFGDGGSVDLNVNGTATVSNITYTTAFGGTPAPITVGSGNVSSFGSFDVVLKLSGGFQDSVDSISFNLTKTDAGTWASAADVLQLNSSGYDVAAHIFVADCSSGTCVNYLVLGPDGKPTGLTGFAANGPNNVPPPPVPEPATWAMMLLGFLGLGFMAYRRRGSTLQFRAA